MSCVTGFWVTPACGSRRWRWAPGPSVKMGVGGRPQMSARGCWTCSPTPAATSSTPPTSTPTGRRKPSSASCSKAAATSSCSPPSSPTKPTRVIRTVPVTTARRSSPLSRRACVDCRPTTSTLRYNLLDRSPERELLPMADAFDLPVFAWGPLAEGRLTGKYLAGQTGRVTEVGRPYTHVGSDDIVRDVVAISDEIGCTPAQVAISWVRQQPGPVIPLIAARTEEQFRDNLAAPDMRLSQQHLDRLDALSRPTLGFPGDVMRETSVVSGVYGAQLTDIDDPRAQAVRRTTTGT